ncbi:hypothetical protein VTH06DRAFT_261 [Thermothelomyces fergusii]
MDTDCAQSHSTPLFLSPVLPSDLIQFVINRCRYPTTLIICGSRGEFVSALAHDIFSQERERQQQAHGEVAQTTTADGSNSDPAPTGEPPRAVSQPAAEPRQGKAHELLTPQLAQVSAARHIRTVFAPTVSHLRAFLSVFTVDSSLAPGKAPVEPPPPAPAAPSPVVRRALLVVYNLLGLHRDTSEWSVQGLGTSCAALVEAGVREGLAVVVAEGPGEGSGGGAGEAERGDGDDEAGHGDLEPRQRTLSGLDRVLQESVPVLGGRGVRIGGERERRGGWAGKTVDVARVLGRWFEFRKGEWITRA